MNTQKIIFSLLTLVALTNNASADSQWTVGLAGLYADGPYHGSQSMVAPLIMYERDRLSVTTLDGIGYRYFDFADEKKSGSLSIIATPRFAPDFGDDLVAHNLKRDHGFDLGLQGNIKFNIINLEFRGQRGITHSRHGYKITTQATYQPNSFPIELGIGANYRDSDLSQYLFGVSESESNQDRTVFSARGELTGFVTGMAAFPLTENLISYGQVVYEGLRSHADSPLVLNSRLLEVTLGVLYQWD